MKTKTCIDCGKTWPLSDFHRNSRRRDGHSGRCKPCTSAHRFILKNPAGWRGPRGETHHSARLTAHDVELIRQLIDEREALLAKAKNLTNAAIAAKFDVHPRTIDRISSYRGWKADYSIAEHTGNLKARV
jgi:hypothetical protein